MSGLNAQIVPDLRMTVAAPRAADADPVSRSLDS
jgi:hypothetical protein